MSGVTAKTVETGATGVASVALGCAVAFAAFMLLEPVLPLPVRSAVAGCASVAACAACWRILSGIGGSPQYPIPSFDPSMFEQSSADAPMELTQASEEPLILDDVLHAVGPESRVVRLFDASAMPSPAELKARVDRYLGQGASWAKSPDASQALVEALTELRRSLR